MATYKKKQNINEAQVPPHDKDGEIYVLGAMIYDPSSYIDMVKNILKPDEFYIDAHKIMCQAIYELSEMVRPDLESLVNHLISKGQFDLVGEHYGITMLMKAGSVYTSANVKKSCNDIKIASHRRIAGRALREASVAVDDTTADPYDALQKTLDTIKGVQYNRSKQKKIAMSDSLMERINKSQTKRYNEQNGIVDPNSLKTGFHDWDKMNSGMRHGVYVIAGRPGMGKGVHMTEAICRMAKKVRVGVINGEMDREELLERMACNLKSFSNEIYYKDGNEISDRDNETMLEGFNEILNLDFDTYEETYIDEIESMIRMWVKHDGMKIIFADFLTLFNVPEHLEKYYVNDTQKTNYVMGVFVKLAKELKVPIILYAQMNREILGRSGTKEPNLADLKSSGKIEELARQVAFLHRPEYFDIPGEENEDALLNIPGLTWFIIAKNRGAKLGRFKLKAELDKSQMHDWFMDDYTRPHPNLDFSSSKVEDAEIVQDDNDPINRLPYKDN